MAELSIKSRKNNGLIDYRRIWLLAAIMIVLTALIIGRLFVLQVLDHSSYSALATKRQAVDQSLIPQRGSIYTQEKNTIFPLVTNRDYYLLYAEPIKLDDAGKVIAALTPILNLQPDESKTLLDRLSRQDAYEPIKHKLTKEQKEQIELLNINGLGFVTEAYRFYPEKNIGGQIFGYVQTQDISSIGKYGLEGYFNQELTGAYGSIKSLKDALGALITIGPRSVQPAVNGDNLILTIDRNVQFTACQKLKKYYEKFSADAGSIIVMNPATGAIMAMCNFPDFDPDNYGAVKDIHDFNNPAIFNAFEPGSVFKMITMAAGLDTGVVSPDSTYVDTGEVKIDKFTIKNSDLKAHGLQTMTQVLQQSLNTGAIFVEQKVGKDVFRDYVKNFGFGQKTGIQLDTEVAGDISALGNKGEIYGMTAAFGQGITATPIQLISAFGAIANQGKLMKPYIVSQIVKPDGEQMVTQPTPVRQVVAPKSASLLTGMLTSVVENSYSQRAKVKGYYLAGKSGTAQVAGPNGQYTTQTTQSFIGFGPVSNPKFVMLVTLNNPKGVRFAESSSVPLFGEMAQFLLNYYQVPPDY